MPDIKSAAVSNNIAAVNEPIFAIIDTASIPVIPSKNG